MKLQVMDVAPHEAQVQLLIVGLFEGEKAVEGGLGRLDTALGGKIELARSQGDFTGKAGQLLTLYGIEKGPRHILIAGLGKRKEWTPEKLRRAFGSAGKTARSNRWIDACLVAPLHGAAKEDEARLTSAAIEGFVLAMYRYGMRSRDLDKHPELKTLKVTAGEAVESAKGFRAAVKQTRGVLEGVLLARDLGNMPPGHLYPEEYGRLAKKLEGDDIKVDVLDQKKLQKLGMGALLAVGQGSVRPPVLIHLTYIPDNLPKKAKTFAIVGKGITFDAGGLDLKPADGMRDMKVDMCGSATVMGVFKALSILKPKVHVEGFIASAENMPDGASYRPGDILTSYKGLTIEVDNTDAEGRLALADALAWAAETVKPDAMVDLATLTGACWIALGNHATGMMGTDDALAEILTAAGEETGERVWRLPLWDEYCEQLASEVADVKNTGGRPGGAITAGCFLKEFVGEVPWIHLDIAGTATEVPYSYVPHKELTTGVGVRLLLETLKRWA